MSLSLSALLAMTCCKGPHSLDPHKDNDGPPAMHVDVSQLPNPIAKEEPLSRSGNRRYYTVRGQTYRVLSESKGFIQRGIASWYGTKFHKRMTSSGEPYNMFAMTAAHRNLPLPTYVRVSNLENKRSIIVKVNDRGPFHENRIIDLSYAAAKKLGILGKGTGYIELEAIDPKNPSYFMKGDTTLQKPKLYLQLGHFAERDSAIHFVNKIKNFINDLPIYLSSQANNSNTMYKVLIGPFLESRQLTHTQKRIEFAGLKTAIPVLR